MNVKLSASERRALAQGTYRHPHSQPLPEGWWDGPWNEPIPHDAVCTPLPVDDDRPVQLGGSFRPALGSGYDWATPFTVVDRNNPPRRNAYEYADNGGVLGGILAGLFGVGRRTVRMPVVSTSQLPWVGGHPADPPSYGDRHYLVVDLAAGELFEAINTRPSLFPSPSWWFSRITRWDLTRPYREQASKHNGVVAARMPKLPHTVRFDEVARGRIDHAIGVALPRYLPGNPQFPAMLTDGRLVRDADGTEVREVPVFAGQRLRLRAEVLAELLDVLPEGSARRTKAVALREFGLVCGDTTARNHGSDWTAPDGRWEFTDLPGFELPLSAFEAVAPFHN